MERRRRDYAAVKRALEVDVAAEAGGARGEPQGDVRASRGSDFAGGRLSGKSEVGSQTAPWSLFGRSGFCRDLGHCAPVLQFKAPFLAPSCHQAS